MSASELISKIATAFDWSEATIAEQLHVQQSSVNRWKNGLTAPKGDHYVNLLALARKADIALANGSLRGHTFHYVCSFAPRYSEDLRTEASAVLEGLLQTFAPVKALSQCARDPRLHIDFFIRAARLPHGIRAHTFESTSLPSRVFIVLVNELLSEREQLSIAWDEAFAHVMRRLIDEPARTKLPRSLIG